MFWKTLIAVLLQDGGSRGNEESRVVWYDAVSADVQADQKGGGQAEIISVLAS